MQRRSFAAGLASSALATWALPAAAAQTVYPSKPVRVVVPYPAGGPNDMIARLLAQPLGDRLHEPFVIDNRPGATGLTGTEQVAKAPADGYTLLVSASVHVIYPALFRKVPFDPLKDFAPISLLGRAPLVMSVHPSLKVSTVKELIAYAKAAPTPLQYASSGNGSATHLAAESFKTMANVAMQQITYKGSAPAMNDVVAGHVQVIFDSVPSSMPFIKSGRLRPLGVTSAQRSSAAPELPSISEAVPGYDISTWYGLWAPAGTPADIVAALSSQVQAVLKTSDMRRRLQELGIEPVGSSPAEFAAYQAAEAPKWARIVKASNAQLD
ncbi:tripartite tricarboxylate transporter substrate binding protein [Xylophilus sp.]|uniref:tripartite tricarboxylate transporter substrate binding protein n=1 Tax=Xylophilus sp. TaxID=2653893 RepID=UPI0013B9A484|nr:tripartite tricarboxylate transporter substrate binding protein [Xylophilus sp.]KAF1047312.1 MAG: hypothetical protein GAK38_02025 [Xylophilus sp.]